MGGRRREQTVGYRYGLGWHAAVCHGPVDAVLAILVDDRVAWSGSATTSQQISVNAPDLFGGDEREGGMVGALDIMMGEPTQGANDYLAPRVGGPLPGFRGILSLVWRGGIVSANNPYLKPVVPRVRRILAGWGPSGPWNPTRAAIALPGGRQSMNPAHIVYQCLTNAEWGMGYPTSSIGASFATAAETFFAEGLGLCMIWNQEGSIEDFITVVCDHVGAVFGLNPRTGTFELRPIRADYNPASLTLYGPADVITIDQFQRAAPGEQINEVTVRYTDIETKKTGSVTMQDLASIRTQGAIVPQTRNYPGIPTQALAQRVAERDLRAVASPIARLRLRAKRTMAGIRPGDVFRLTWPALGLTDVVFRAIKTSGGTLTSGEVTIEAAEDVFAFPTATYAGQQSPGWVDPVQAPAVAPDETAFEAPFFELVRFLGLSEASALPADAGFAAAAASRPSAGAFDWSMQVNPGSGYEERDRGVFCPTARLVGAIGPTTTAIAFNTARDVSAVQVNTYAQIGLEIVRVVAINAAAGTATIARGVLDTVPRSHLAATRIFFLDGYVASDDTQRVGGETGRVKVLPQTGLGQLALAAAAELTFSFAQRAARPYPPGRLRLGPAALAYPAGLVDVPLVISWAHRNRLAQSLEDESAGDIGPEPGTTYTVRVTNVATSTVLDTQTGVTGTSVTYNFTGSLTLRVEVWSVRAGLASAQIATHEFTYLNISRITTEAADRITTEGGDTITGE